MLDGKRYYANFPDEDPGTRRIGLQSVELLATLAALEKEFRAFLQQEASTPAESDLDRNA
jgi:hypothetical protein